MLADAGTGQILNKVHVNQKVRKLLAVGKRYIINDFSCPKQAKRCTIFAYLNKKYLYRRFAVILLPYVDTRYKNLAVVDLKERKIIGGYTVPHSR